MPELIFSDRLPSGMQYSFVPALFNQLNYLYQLTPGPYRSFFIVNERTRSLAGQIHFNINDNIATSLSQALFGSFEFHESLPEEVITGFIQYVNDQLEFDGIKKIDIVHPSKIYDTHLHDPVIVALQENGYEKAMIYKNHHIPIDENTLEQKMHSMEQRKLQKCRDHHLKFINVPVDQLNDIFDFIYESRNEKSIPISITKDKLKHSIELFPENYHLFSVKDENKTCAATVAVKTTGQVLYNFLPSSSPSYNHLSPAVMLYEGLYQYCQEHRYNHLDLGISTLPDGTDQKGLITFKENIGGIETFKYKFSRSVD